MELSNKAAYIKGLIDGMKLDETDDKGRVLKAMAELLSELAASVEDVAEEVNETVELVDILDKDLSEVEDILFEDAWDEDEDDEPEDDDPEDEFETAYECECPTCGDIIRLDESVLAGGSIDCPNCGEHLEFDYEDDGEE